MNEWQPIETAPKDGRAVFLLSAAHDEDVPFEGKIHYPAKCHIGCWDPEGTSWVNEHGQPGGLCDGEGCYELAVTGIWTSGGGWFQPNEVTHWMPLPEPPSEHMAEAVRRLG